MSRYKHPRKWLLFRTPGAKSQLLCLSWLFRLESYTHYVLVALVSMSVSQCVKSQEYSSMELRQPNASVVVSGRIDGTIRNLALAFVAFPGKPLYSLNASPPLTSLKLLATCDLLREPDIKFQVNELHREALSTPIP